MQAVHCGTTTYVMGVLNPGLITRIRLLLEKLHDRFDTGY